MQFRVSVITLKDCPHNLLSNHGSLKLRNITKTNKKSSKWSLKKILCHYRPNKVLFLLAHNTAWNLFSVKFWDKTVYRLRLTAHNLRLHRTILHMMMYHYSLYFQHRHQNHWRFTMTWEAGWRYGIISIYGSLWTAKNIQTNNLISENILSFHQFNRPPMSPWTVNCFDVYDFQVDMDTYDEEDFSLILLAEENLKDLKEPRSVPIS